MPFFLTTPAKTSHKDMPPRTKHPMPFLTSHAIFDIPCNLFHPGQNISCHFCHSGQNIQCHFFHSGQNIPCYFCHPRQNIQMHAISSTPDRTSHATFATPHETSHAISATPDKTSHFQGCFLVKSPLIKQFTLFVRDMLIILWNWFWYMSRGMRFPTIWHIDKCRLGRASAAFF